jgi:hypothetical protein
MQVWMMLVAQVGLESIIVSLFLYGKLEDWKIGKLGLRDQGIRDSGIEIWGLIPESPIP